MVILLYLVLLVTGRRKHQSSKLADSVNFDVFDKIDRVG